MDCLLNCSIEPRVELKIVRFLDHFVGMDVFSSSVVAHVFNG